MTFRIGNFRRRSIAWIAAVAVLFTGLPSLSLLARESDATRPEAVGTTRKAGVPAQALSREAIQSAIVRMKSMKAPHYGRVVARAERMQLFYDYMYAPTPEAAKAALRAIRDDRLQRASVAGEEKLAQAKPTLRFAPGLKSLASTLPEGLEDILTGPAARSECYLEEEEPCVTPEEEAEFEMFLEESQWELASLESDYSQSMDDYESYCSQYPENCMTPEEGMIPSSGPNAARCDASCWDQANEAVVEIVATGIAALLAAGKLDEARQAAKYMSKYTVMALRATIWTGVITASFWTGFFTACVIDTYLLESPTDPFEATTRYHS